MAALAPQPQLDSTPYSQSIMEDASDTESDPDLDAHLDPEQQHFYQRQQEQAMWGTCGRMSMFGQDLPCVDDGDASQVSSPFDGH